jgi:hypothetical protein
MSLWIAIPVGALFVLALFAILLIEDNYYRRHPEKERPEVSMWP